MSHIVYNILKAKQILKFKQLIKKIYIYIEEMVSMAFLNKIANQLKGISQYLLVNERINSQRCVAKNIDTTKTIFDKK